MGIYRDCFKELSLHEDFCKWMQISHSIIALLQINMLFNVRDINYKKKLQIKLLNSRPQYFIDIKFAWLSTSSVLYWYVWVYKFVYGS